MATEDVVVKMGAETAEMLRAWAQMSRSMDNAAKKAEEFGGKGKKAAGEFDRGMDRLMGRMVSVQGAISLATGLLNTLTEAQREFNREAAKAELDRDATFRGLQLQSGTFDAAGAAKMKAQINAVVAANPGLTGQAADRSASALISGGFSKEAALGSLEPLAQGAQATNQLAILPEVARAMAMLLNATGQAQTPDSVRRMGLASRGLFEGTNFQASDMAALSGEMGAIHGLSNTSVEEELAFFAQLRKTKGAEQSAVQLRNAVLNLRTAGGKQEGLDALSTLGMKPGDVDFLGEGEDMSVVFGRLDAARKSVAPDVADIALAKLVGKENMTGALAAMGGVGKVDETIALMSDEARFGQAVAVAQSGPLAEQAAGEERLNRFREQAGQAAVNTELDRIEAQIAEDTGSGTLGKVGRGFATAGQAIADFFGMGGVPAVKELTEATKENTRAMQNQKMILVDPGTGQQAVAAPMKALE